MKEIDDYKNKGDILMIEAERKPNDIKNSVLWTGKIPEVGEVKDSEDANEEEAKEETPKDEVDTALETEIIEEEGTTKEDINIEMPKIDYKVPTMPMVNNPNIIRSNPINPYNVPTNNFGNPNPLNNYYNTFINPYVYQNQNFNYASQQQPRPGMVNYNRGIISNNFQGKIPVSYGNPYVNQYVAGLQTNNLIGMNMNINRPNMMGRMMPPNMPNMPIRPSIIPNVNPIRPMAPGDIKKEDKDDIQIENLKN
jgi:hypothetical protein